MCMVANETHIPEYQRASNDCKQQETGQRTSFNKEQKAYCELEFERVDDKISKIRNQRQYFSCFLVRFLLMYVLNSYFLL